ncbi:MAG: CDP-alcohol phosphatidyltransferase family protein [Patescibacteria group bacterium]
MSTFNLYADFKKGIIPNSITLLGIILMIISIILFDKGLLLPALAFFVSGWIADLFDGWSARKYKRISQIGTFFDPLADKFNTIVYLIYFWNNISIIISITIIAIGVSLTVLRIYKWYYGKKKNIEYNIMARNAGKIKTNVERSAFCLFLLIPICQKYFFEINQTIETNIITFINWIFVASIIFAILSLHKQIQEIS